VGILIEEEAERGLTILARLERRQQEQLAARGGEPFAESAEIIDQMREERLRHLMSPHGS
jgi:hypothetical protein